MLEHTYKKINEIYQYLYIIYTKFDDFKSNITEIQINSIILHYYYLANVLDFTIPLYYS